LNPFYTTYVNVTYNATFYTGFQFSQLNAISPGIFAAASSNQTFPISQTALDQIAWVLSQNFTAPSFGGQYNYGEVQEAIWDLLGYTNYYAIQADYLTNTYGGVAHNVLNALDVANIKSLAIAAAQDPNNLPEIRPIVINPQPIAQRPNETPQSLIVLTAGLGDYVWDDKNGDGKQDATETGIPGATVTLTSGGADGKLSTTGDNTTATTATDANGQYAFTGLVPGREYQVTFTTPNGYGSVSPRQSDGNPASGTNSDGLVSDIVKLLPGEFNRTIDSGFYQTASLGDRLWLDADGDGKQNADHTLEPGVSGKTVTLIGGGADGVINGIGDTAATTATGADGVYQFAGLAPGVEYQVQFGDIPGGSVFTAPNVGADDAVDSDASPADGKTQIVALAPGENNATLDAGVYAPASVSGYVYKDAGDDGARNAEPGIAGVLLTLTGADAAGNPVPAGTTAVTDANGHYRFDNLAPGAYTVSEAQPAGYADGKDTAGSAGGDATSVNDVIGGIALKSGDNSVENNFGELTPTASLGDRLWLDADGDGKQNADHTLEPGVSGKTVTLIGGGADGVINGIGDTAATTATGADGVYQFAGLAPGVEYQVQFGDIPGGSVFTAPNVGADDAVDSDASPADGKTQIVALAPGENNATLDAGVYAPASLGDYVWLDKDLDGLQGDAVTEPGVNDVTVKLLHSDGSPVLDGNNAPVTATTGDNPHLAGTQSGYYEFAGLTPGVPYQVQFVAPAGYAFTQKDAGGNTTTSDSVDSDADQTTGKTQAVTLASGEHNPTLDAGLIDVGTNGDPNNPIIDIEKLVRSRITVQNPGEPEGLTPGFWKTHSEYGPAPHEGWQDTGYSPIQTFESIFGVNVTVGNGNPTLLEALGMNGGGESALLRHAAAALLNAANPYVDYAYSVSEVIAMTQAAFAASDFEATKNLFATQNELGADLTTLAGTSATVVYGDWMDADASGTGPAIPIGQEAEFQYIVTSNTALGNVTVTDNRISGLTFKEGDANGNNVLDLLETWIYTASETVTGSGEIENKGTATGASPISGKSATDSDLAHYTAFNFAALGDRVWEDLNANGKQDSGEPGIAGVTVQLLDKNGQVAQTTTTDANGNYLFDVAPSAYSVKIPTLPSGYAVSPKDQGTDDKLDSDIDAATLTTAPVSIADGEVNLSVDAGLYKPAAPATLGNFVWNDANANGIQDATEKGIPNVVVDLKDSAGNVIDSETTDANGAYQFSVAPGTYKVAIDSANFSAGGPLNNWLASPSNATGSTAANDSNPQDYTVALASGQSDQTIDFGYFNPGSGGEPPCVDVEFNFVGNSSADGSDGNIRSYTVNGVSVNVSAFSREKGTTGPWSKAWLGAYDHGLGVTDSGEGDGGNNTHAVDNVGRDNYVLFEFSQTVEIDKAYLGYVVNDSDMKVWIGTFPTAFSNHMILSDAVLASFGFTEVNLASSDATRWADFNAGGILGNALVIAADPGDTSPEDRFKIEKLAVCAPSDAPCDAVADAPTLTIQATGTGAPPPASTGLLKQWYDVTSYIDTAVASNVLNVETKLQNNNTPTSAGTATTGINLSVAADDAYRFSGLIYLEAGKSYTLSGVWDDTALIKLGGNIVLQKNYNTWGNYTATSFTPAQSGYYTVETIAYNGDGPGNFSAKLSVNGGTAQDLSSANFKLYKSDADIGTDHGAFQSNGDGGFYPAAAALNSGAKDTFIKLSAISAALTDTDGSETLSLSITGIPAGATLKDDSGHTFTATTGNVSTPVTGWNLAGLSIKPASGFTGTFDLGVTATSTENCNGATASASGKITVNVTGSGTALASIGDRVWEDQNHNWLQDAGEPGIPGVKVTLKTPGADNAPNTGDDAAIATVYTDANGKYLFSNLNPGNYFLEFNKAGVTYKGYLMDNWKWAVKDSGANDSIDSDVIGNGSSLTNLTRTDVTALSSGENDLTWDAGITPIVIDLGGDGIHTIARSNATGSFDLLGNGAPIKSGWISGDDAFLAVDANGNGAIDDLSELFGGLNKGDGYAKLAAYDSNGDGAVNADDAGYANLLVWRDLNGDHRSEPGELMGLAQTGVASLNVDYVERPILDENGNLRLETGAATLASGQTVEMTDVYFNVSAADAAQAGVTLPSLMDLLAGGVGLVGCQAVQGILV
jgi:protocatechuate 3,4-dioxygenase beta subunit